MSDYRMEPERATLHGHFSRDLPPVLTIESGDRVRFRTIDAGWGLEGSASPGASRRKFEPRDEQLDIGHALCGPVEIKGALPGMNLEIEINDLRPGDYGWTVAGGWSSEVNDRLGVVEDETYLIWTLDAERMVGRNHLGYEIDLHPFMGVMGMTPDEPGILPTSPPRPSGGNIDCKELVAGSRLYLPIAVPGGLFSVGDGHAAQADGEAGGTAIECPMDVVDLTFRLHEDMHLTTPRANTAAGWITFGFHKDLNEATITALDAMLDLLNEQYGLQRSEALAMASLVVDLRITQIVNGVRGVHAILPHGAINRRV
ncbi:MAG: acetamidase/formamidase family protein [Chloroflexia bacterium]